MNQQNIKRKAFLFLLLLGLISLLSDFTHEGARSIYGPYLGLLGASVLVISITSGLGEFIGQSLRIVTGVIADKTKKYWLMMFVGYALNLLVIPLLMFVDASIWEVALILILLERVGKGIRAPAKSALTSFTAPHLGAGKSFALQEAMDQFGAFLGPLFVFLVLNLNKGSELQGYQLAFGLLGIFAILTLVILFVAKMKYPNPDHFESKGVSRGFKGNKAFILYMIAIMLIALGFIDYPILAYHMGTTSTIDVIYIPLLYALAMGVDAIAALIFGHYFDKKGILSLIISVFISVLIAPVFFLIDGTWGIIMGVILWGIGMGAQESILKAVISVMVSKEKRATAYGIFYTVFGSAWFLGSVAIGWLYSLNIAYMVIFSVLMELLAVIFLMVYRKRIIATSLKEV
ncbi:MAG: MFS transporter [Erysipelotrichia bacterium]|nr:MFS transporter [Erysipelotrichia bacterium]